VQPRVERPRVRENTDDGSVSGDDKARWTPRIAANAFVKSVKNVWEIAAARWNGGRDPVNA
jgi:hypothetical protein